MANQKNSNNKQIDRDRDEQNPAPKTPPKDQDGKIDQMSEDSDQRDPEGRMY